MTHGSRIRTDSENDATKSAFVAPLFDNWLLRNGREIQADEANNHSADAVSVTARRERIFGDRMDTCGIVVQVHDHRSETGQRLINRRIKYENENSWKSNNLDHIPPIDDTSTIKR
ncbi:hypothetical protein LSH36_292g03041 [Paralvinella palmiformis]|uniref:Uncharacterized protein n=1 Tax=Paralvinella palmiformis TaxID=53620 RepID=A0AAD9N302_9ANNE|nr:hypothetical protein LSH36_292g03041 [Paralvinella palmiformis]